MTREQLAKYIDAAALSPTTREQDIIKLCRLNATYKFASLCVPSYYVPCAKRNLTIPSTNLCTVIGFPFGYTNTESKITQSLTAIDAGATELDIVANIGNFLDGYYKSEIQALSLIIRKVKDVNPKVIVKVIIEACYLSKLQLKRACEVVISSRAAYIKTSTGFGTKGATASLVKQIKMIVKDRIKIKAAGGITTTKKAISLINAGAARIGSSHPEKILEGLPK